MNIVVVVTLEVTNVETEEVFEHDDAAGDIVVMDTEEGTMQSEATSYVSTMRLNIINDCNIDTRTDHEIVSTQLILTFIFVN